ncbi:MAG TPA: hypothetical protein VF630_08335 [Hymenobacter sp.]|jgi:hypothetical protein
MPAFWRLLSEAVSITRSYANMTNGEKIGQELELLENAYRQRFPNAQQLEGFSFGPENLVEILREANGREIVFSYPLQNQGVVDGCE